MASEVSIPPVGHRSPVEHLCLRYHSRDELVAAALPFLRTGLAQGERCVYVSTAPAECPVLSALAPEVAAGAGALTVLGPEESYLQGGSFDPERVIDWLAAETGAATRAGFSGLRIVGEMAVVSGPVPGVGRLQEYESAVNRLVADLPLRSLCAYTDRAPSFREALSTHPGVWVRGARCRNPHYVPPEEYLAPTRPLREIDGLLERLWEAEMADERRRQVSRRLHGAQEAERRALSRELHDEVGQILAAIQLRLPEDDAETRALVGEVVEVVRTLALEVRPSILDDLGLAAALRSFVRRRAGRDPFVLDLDLGELDRVPPAVATTCFRLVQEAVANAARHAGATRVRVQVDVAGGRLALEVRDDGRGFDPAARRGEESLGLLGMAERVDLAGGELSLTSAPGRGTTVRATLPLGGGRP